MVLFLGNMFESFYRKQWLLQETLNAPLLNNGNNKMWFLTQKSSPAATLYIADNTFLVIYVSDKLSDPNITTFVIYYGTYFSLL